MSHVTRQLNDSRLCPYGTFVRHVKDDSKTINDLVTAAVGRIGENVQVRRFSRFMLGEGLEKKKNDLAAEVAAAVSGQA